MMTEPPLTRGDSEGLLLLNDVELDLVRPRAEVAVYFLCGEAPALRT